LTCKVSKILRGTLVKDVKPERRVGLCMGTGKYKINAPADTRAKRSLIYM
jgi:hypothetical protein